MSAPHDELRRLVEEVPADKVWAAVAFLQQLARPTAARREFGCAGTLTAEPDFAERSEDILREEFRRTDPTA